MTDVHELRDSALGKAMLAFNDRITALLGGEEGSSVAGVMTTPDKIAPLVAGTDLVWEHVLALSGAVGQEQTLVALAGIPVDQVIGAAWRAGLITGVIYAQARAREDAEDGKTA